MKQCNLLPDMPAQACSNALKPQSDYVVKNGELYIDGAYFGYLVGQSPETITVRCDNGNMYMQDKEFKIEFVS